MLTEVPLTNPNYKLWADKGRFLLRIDGFDVNSTSSVSDGIGLLDLLWEKYGPFTKGAIQAKGEEAAALGTAFKVEVQISNSGNIDNFTSLASSATGAGGSITSGIDLTGGWTTFRIKCETAEGAACTASVWFSGTYTN